MQGREGVTTNKDNHNDNLNDRANDSLSDSVIRDYPKLSRNNIKI